VAGDGLTPDAFAARLSALNPPKRLALALSGGRDSVALLRLCAGYAKTGNLALSAFTVDHGLRPEAAAEAEQAGAWARSAGVPHRILRWTGAKPASGLQAAARAARYRLLIDAAESEGCGALVTAHTLDDQAETLFMRLARGGGPAGLAAMRAQSLIANGAGEPLRLLRPMLSFSRADVTDWLGETGQTFIDDPSNDDPAFERVRVRALLAALAEQDILTAEKLAETAARAAKAAERLARQEDALLDAFGGVFHGWGGVSLARWRAEAPGAAGLARRLIHAAGGGEFAPEEDAAAHAAANALETGAGTLGGALIRLWKSRLWFLREPAALTGRAGSPPASPQPLDGRLLWDRRFAVLAGQGGSALEVGAMGEGACAFLGVREGLFDGPPEALAAMPGVYRNGVLIGAPALPFMETGQAIAKSLVQERYAGRIVRFY
jgi:tRNA(Ile)-lysidine synthase